jgi:hypothetical protein
MFEIPELGSLTGLVMEELRKGELLKQVRARERQGLIQKKRGEQKYLRSGGVMTSMIPPESFHYWGQRLGYECWEDDGFVREFLRDNAECRVHARAANASVGWRAESMAHGAERKYHKNYGVLGEEHRA